MGTFNVELEIGDPDGLRHHAVKTLVDSGATYTSAPASLFHELGVIPLSSGTFALADGSKVVREIGQTWVRIEDERYIVPVIFAEEDSRPLLGAVTLETIRLGIDPVRGHLVPVDGLLLNGAS